MNINYRKSENIKILVSFNREIIIDIRNRIIKTQS